MAKGCLAKSLGWDGETVRFGHVEARTKGDEDRRIKRTRSVMYERSAKKS